MRNSVTPEEIDALLPQTQCGLCGHGGCMPYAEAIVFDQAEINLCPPGGVKILYKLGELLDINSEPYIADMLQKEKPPALAVIREDECIGCMKCITACPVDAIVGTAKQMHTIIATECTGCELCIPPCPVDCIDLMTLSDESEKIKKEKANLARVRFNTHESRVSKEKIAKNVTVKVQSNITKINYIEAAIARAKAKKA